MEDRFSTVSSSNLTPDINKAKANVALPARQLFQQPELHPPERRRRIRWWACSARSRFNSRAQWTQILAEAGEDVDFMTLWYEKNDAGANADGEYAWIYEDAAPNNHLTHQSNFYQFRAPTLGTAGGVAYPGLQRLLPGRRRGQRHAVRDPAQQRPDARRRAQPRQRSTPANIDFLQLATFNDFGEGTMFEPTVETGFDYLKRIQQFTGVPYGEAELELVYRLYLARKEYAGNASIEGSLDEVSNLLAGLDIAGATNLLNATAPSGDFNGDGDVDANDYTAWRNAFGSSTILYGSGTDGNYDGVINTADYIVWRNSMIGAGTGSSFAAVPEPSTFALSALAGGAFWVRRQRIRAVAI